MAQQGAGLVAWQCVSVGVANLDHALALWRDTFGFEQRGEVHGPDADLAELWDIDADAISRQVLLGTGGMDVGRLHLVQFAQPAAPVRAKAQVFDLCPKNLDIYVDDLPLRFEQLKRRGYQFRNDHYSEVTAPDGTVFREIHLPSHDAINVVLLQVLGDSHPYTLKGFAGIGPLIAIVSSAAAEKAFFAQALGMGMQADNLLSGPEVEKMVGLPPGAELDVSIWGAPGGHFGQMELIEYRGVKGANLYPAAKPPALGVLHVNYRCDSPQMYSNLAERLQQLNVPVQRRRPIRSLAGNGEVMTVFTPTGLRLDVFSG